MLSVTFLFLRTNHMNVKPVWVFISGLALLYVFVLVISWSRSRHVRPHSWTPSQHADFKKWILPGQTRHYEGFDGPDATFYMFGVDWCPHCVSTKPEFAALGPTQTIGGKTVQCILVDPEKEPEKAKGFQIDGYPTLLLQKSDGATTKYAGPRTQSGFLQFLQQSM